MTPTITLEPKQNSQTSLRECYPWPVPAGDRLHHRDSYLVYESGATITTNLCCQIATEQFDKVQLSQRRGGGELRYRYCEIAYSDNIMQDVAHLASSQIYLQTKEKTKQHCLAT